MTNEKATKVNPDDLHQWFYTAGVDELIEKSTTLSESYMFIGSTDEQGNPTELAYKAMRSADDLVSILSVVRVVKAELEKLSN
jgi:hypothetical protein